MYEPNQNERMLVAQKTALEMLLQGCSLQQILTHIVHAAENELPKEIIGSVLLVSEDGTRLLHGAAPSISDDFNRYVNGIGIGPTVGSCGAAVYHGHEIIVEDIATDLRWKDYAPLALSHDLRACWSTPIRSSRAKIIGTFALYCRVARKPFPAELEMVAILSQTAGIVIQWHQQQQAKRNADVALVESEQRFQNLIRDASVGIIVLEGEDNIVSLVNAAYARLVGRVPEELLNKPLFSVIPDAKGAFSSFVNHVRTTGEPVYLYEQAYQVQYADTSIAGFLNLVYQPYLHANGNITGVMVLCHDVTAQVLARQKMMEAEETARLAVASAELGTFQLDLLTNEVIASPRLYQIFDIPLGSQREQMIEAIHPDDLAMRDVAYDHAFSSSVLEYESRIIRKNGVIRWARTKGKVFYDDDGKAVKLVGVVQDVTDEKEFAAELARQVKIRSTELEQFVFVSHHDLQEPLRKIKIFSDKVLNDRDSQLSEYALTAVQKINAAAVRMSTALHGVLNLAKAGNQERFVHVDLNEIVAAVLVDQELAIAEKNATIRLQQLPQIMASPHQMQQLFYNLLSNALKFTRSGVQPEISVSVDQVLENGISFHHIIVKDNGVGFDSKYAEKIFALFQRLHTREEYPGTGIGLALCQRVVENHGGRIWAESIPGNGAVFHILLPAMKANREP